VGRGVQGGGGEGLFFTVHDTLTDTTPFTLTVDAAALGIAEPKRLVVTELVSGDVVSYEAQGDLLVIQGELAPLDTVVFQLQKELVPTTVYLPLTLKVDAGGEAGIKR
jgi:hypothetical protein